MLLLARQPTLPGRRQAGLQQPKALQASLPAYGGQLCEHITRLRATRIRKHVVFADFTWDADDVLPPCGVTSYPANV